MNTTDRKLRRVQKRQQQLEEYKKSKQQAKEIMKRVSRPPFRPVGKSTAFQPEKQQYLDRMVEKHVNKTRLQMTTMNRTSKKITSTPRPEGIMNQIPKPFIRTSPRLSADSKFEIKTPKFTPSSKLDITKRKSVQFKNVVFEISPQSVYRKSDSFNKEKSITIEDNIRRVSYAGRTPFSCTNSRSGSTPGRKDCISTLTDGETINHMYASQLKDNSIKDTSKSKRRQSRSNYPTMKWSVPRNSNIERDPYLLRIRTPIQMSSISKSVNKSKSFNKSLMSKTLSIKKKGLKVNFADKIVESDSNKSSRKSLESINNTIDLLQSCSPKTPIFKRRS